MNAPRLICFQQDQDTEFRQLSQEPIDAATAASLAAAAEIEWAAVTEMRTTAASSPAEVAARAELLAGFIKRDRFDDEVWADMMQQIATDLRAMLPASAASQSDRLVETDYSGSRASWPTMVPIMSPARIVKPRSCASWGDLSRVHMIRNRVASRCAKGDSQCFILVMTGM